MITASGSLDRATHDRAVGHRRDLVVDPELDPAFRVLQRKGDAEGPGQPARLEIALLGGRAERLRAPVRKNVEHLAEALAVLG